MAWSSNRTGVPARRCCRWQAVGPEERGLLAEGAAATSTRGHDAAHQELALETALALVVGGGSAGVTGRHGARCPAA